MTPATRIIDPARPGQIGYFQRYVERWGKRFAVVKFSCGVRSVPAERIERAVKPGRKPITKAPRVRKKPGRKPRRLTPAEIEIVAQRFGHSEAEFERLAQAAGVTVRMMLKTMGSY